MKTLGAGVLALLALAACALQQPAGAECPGSMLIRQFPGGAELKRLKLTPKGRFALSFIHSVSLTPVRDDYQVRGEKIVQTSVTFKAHGAGLPSGRWEPNATGWERKNGSFFLPLTRPIPKLVVRTDRRYRNRLHLSGRVIDLNQWPDQALEILIRPCQDR
ncbi:MAG: DUF1850 domain-containing protein [Desulfarculaceae bacterium]|jgi:hypothetical protein